MRAPTLVWWKTWSANQKHPPCSPFTVSIFCHLHVIYYHCHFVIIIFQRFTFKDSSFKPNWRTNPILSCHNLSRQRCSPCLLSRPTFQDCAWGCCSSKDSTDRENYLLGFFLYLLTSVFGSLRLQKTIFLKKKNKKKQVVRESQFCPR